MARSGAALLLEVLRSEGVRHVFGNPGTTEMPVMDAIASASDVAYVLALQEAAVVAMADGYAQATGRPAFVNLHAAGGLGHGMGAVLAAQIARTPLVVTAGQQDTRHGFMDPLLSGNLTAIAAPGVKWAHEIADPDHIPTMVRRAFQDSAAAPAGPVFLSLPIDVMERSTTADAGTPSRINRAAVAGGLDQLAEALAAITPGRLALVVGDEVARAGASDAAVTLAETLGARVYGSSWPGPMPFPATHPLWRGNLPTAAAEMRMALAGCDAILELGGNAFISYLYSKGPAVPPTCRLFQLSADPADLGRIYQVALACVGELRGSLQTLQPILAPMMTKQAGALDSLRHEAATSRESRLSALEQQVSAEQSGSSISAFAAVGEVLRAIGSDVTVVDEAAVTMNHARRFLERSVVRRYHFMRSAILGWGLPAAVGMSLGLDRSPVVALLGDGASLYSPQGLWTAAREKLPVTFVVMNNREYNILKGFANACGYKALQGGAIAGMDLTDPSIDFMAIAVALGVRSQRVTRLQDLASVIEVAISSGAPNLVEIMLGGG